MISAPLIEYLKKGIFTLLGLILAVYLFVILMTYTGNDPSWSHISSDMTAVNNMGGEMGAWLSDLLYSFFGFGAWWLLAFLVYESVLIWWDNKPTFWLLRLVAYVFLLLSASALFAQLVALVQQVADPMVSGLKGIAGGIIGLELQARLAQLLSQWGSVTFLTVFVIITATFAFNIHWLAIYQKIKTWSWRDAAVQDNDSKRDNRQAAQTASEQQQNDASVSDEKAAQGFEQLPLDLSATDHANHAQTADKSGRFNNVLKDFLATSGLGASVKASMSAAAAVAQTATSSTAQDEQLQTASANASSFSHVNQQQPSAPTANPVMVPARKVEPSFAWNDADTVDDLLASEAIAGQDTFVYDAAAASNTNIQGFDKSAAPNTSDNIVNAAADELETTESVDSSAIDSLVDAWLAEHAAVAVAPELEEDKTLIEAPVLDTSFDTAAQEQKADHSLNVNSLNNVVDDSIDDLSESWSIEQPDSSYDTEPLAKPETVSTSAAEFATPVDTISNVAKVTDMTPTNTPPANPKLEPTAATGITETNASPVTATKPTVSFAVPEGDSSNHIADMMPEDDSRADDTDLPVMPHISDDAAFSQKSRSMQTAAYRSSLTPIPEISILDKPDPDRKPSYTLAELEQLSELLEIKLQEFNVKASVVNAIPGPVVTRFEVELAAGVKASKVTGISRDLARSLSMASLRVVEVIPGKPYIGIEVPNKQREMVRLIELLNTEKFNDPKAQISMAMGKDIGGNPIITDLARAPHMLVAGTTGSGKSVLVNSMLLSMLLKYTPNELRLILIDPKQLELANYNDIPHLLTPVVTDMTEAASALSWCVAEMERRYQLMSLLKVRKLNEFNKKVIAAEKSGNPMLDPLWRPNDSVSISQATKLKTLPMIVIVADEFADMIMQVGKQAEELITRLAQKSRAAGIHLMLATQRPSVDVITGLIKANIPVRAALRVNSKVDSRTILDSGGAEDMLGNGDMLFLGPGQIEPDRVHGAYVSDEEVNRVCDAWRERGAPDYIDNMAGNFELMSPGGGASAANASGEDDDLYNDAVAFIMETRKVSASSIQRKFSIGYNRAARIVDSMEEAGLVSSMGKSGKRELLM
ncbi:DNA translocase FtsK 4TM domain-containing protein [Psychrobacter maritimus]|uniref:DNA translocase FtsK n=1 Tax=Psychrobacter maritimus TaxID=256325 RepID=UPI00248B6940|nr:DNA translocase FtsK [Psychrobacter sp. WB2]WGV12487.1 DNA translocase FtsK 4TM domain-containing protein [Psychrobacter sp. WB2]